MSPKDIKCFLIKVILYNIKGARNYKEFRTIQGVVYEIFREAARDG